MTVVLESIDLFMVLCCNTSLRGATVAVSHSTNVLMITKIIIIIIIIIVTEQTAQLICSGKKSNHKMNLAT